MKVTGGMCGTGAEGGMKVQENESAHCRRPSCGMERWRVEEGYNIIEAVVGTAMQRCGR